MNTKAPLALSAPNSPGEDTAHDKSIATPFGSLVLQFGLPATREDVRKLYDALDFQRACQAYLWALPLVSFVEWQRVHEQIFGAHDGQLVLYNTYRDKLGILTADVTTPYLIAFANLHHTGPLVVDFPEGPLSGSVADFWQRTISDMGATGPDLGRGAKYLIVGPNQKDPRADGYRVIRTPMNNVMFGVRSLEPNAEKSQALIDKLTLYPYSRRANAPVSPCLTPEGKLWSQGQPRGLNYWERLHTILQEEPVEACDRMMVAMLAPLGIEKGKSFTPTDHQKKLLMKGAEIGELMAVNLSFNRRFDGALYRKDTRWVYTLETKVPKLEDARYTPLDQRAAWFYEAVSVGTGQACLACYHDRLGHWFNGANTYSLRVPPHPPAKQFWSLTLYNTRTRSLIDNPQGAADLSSRMDLRKNEDGSADLYMGPTAPIGHEKNWISTVPGKAWFAYFRLYAPTEAYFDASWHLPDIEKVNLADIL